MERYVTSPGKDNGSFGLSDKELRSYRRHSEEWLHVVEEIRKRSGLETFLEGMQFTALQQAAQGGPVIILNTHELRSDVIILMKDRKPSLVPLLALEPKRFDQLAMRFTNCLREDESRERKVRGILRELWDDIVEPVVNCLQASGVEHGSRISWWCPTSGLSYLPIHAAGLHRKSRPDLSDLYVSSYTTALTALIKSRQPAGYHASPTSQMPSFLLVAQANPPDSPSIPAIEKEFRVIQNVVTSTDLLFDNDGTYSTVMAGLQAYRWVHMS
ncbi:hypothetical protein FRC03_001157 [Tulasnella sp. 419]|nr:hypothetical protein FRC03_001157 [Tulasnella sp. 419]